MESGSYENIPKKRPRSTMRTDVLEVKGSEPNENDATEDKANHCNYVKGDGWNIALLLFLYLLQGIPLGLSAAIPIILQNRKVNYSDQVIINFSMC